MLVRSPNSEQARLDIEIMSDQFLPKGKIRFVLDGAGQYFITYNTINAPLFAPIKQFILENTHDVEYVPPADPE
jgi:hypothetical protein